MMTVKRCAGRRSARIAGSPGVKIKNSEYSRRGAVEWPGAPGYGALPPAQPSNREEAGDERTPAADSSPTSVVPGDLQSNSVNSFSRCTLYGFKSARYPRSKMGSISSVHPVAKPLGHPAVARGRGEPA
jgi:hypothetical protein